MNTVPTNKIVGGILLVAGTAIGAGMLALPITTGVGGFFYAMPLFIICFIYMLTSLFTLLEANLYSKAHSSNIITMAKDSLGATGQLFAWGSFLLLLYAASAAYMAGGGSLISSCALQWFAWQVTPHNGSIFFAFLFGVVAFFGIRSVDLLNRLFMMGLIVCYLLLVFTVGPHVKISYLSGGYPKLLWATVPIVVVSFTSHIILPSLREYLGGHVQSLKKVLIFGSLLPLIFYTVWEYLLVGILPFDGDHGLLAIAQDLHPLAKLSIILHKRHITGVATNNALFSFFAMVTSYLGVIISLIDFLADGFKIDKSVRGRVLLLLSAFVPPLLFALYYPSGFVAALSYAGVFVAILYGIIPVAIVYKARYVEKRPVPEFVLPGGKLPLAIIMIGAIGIIILQIYTTQHWLPTP